MTREWRKYSIYSCLYSLFYISVSTLLQPSVNLVFFFSFTINSVYCYYKLILCNIFEKWHKIFGMMQWYFGLLQKIKTVATFMILTCFVQQDNLLKWTPALLFMKQKCMNREWTLGSKQSSSQSHNIYIVTTGFQLSLSFVKLEMEKCAT